MGELETKIGELLKLERERQGKKLSIISENLRISETNLKSVEAGDVAAVPSEIYFNLFAKSYAEAIGIDYSATLDAIREDLAQQADDPRKARRGKAAPDDRDQIEMESEEEAVPEKPATHWKAVGIAGAVIVVLLGAYGVYNIFPSKSADDNSDLAAALSNPAYVNYNWNTPAYTPPDSLRLMLTPRGESWGTVLADGDTAVFRNMVPGRVYYAAAKYRIEMYVALPKVVDITLNGKPISPIDAETGKNSRIEITQANADSLLAPARGDANEVTTPSTATPRTTMAPNGITTASQAAADTTESGDNEL